MCMEGNELYFNIAQGSSGPKKTLKGRGSGSLIGHRSSGKAHPKLVNVPPGWG